MKIRQRDSFLLVFVQGKTALARKSIPPLQPKGLGGCRFGGFGGEILIVGFPAAHHPCILIKQANLINLSVITGQSDTERCRELQQAPRETSGLRGEQVTESCQKNEGVERFRDNATTLGT